MLPESPPHQLQGIRPGRPRLKLVAPGGAAWGGVFAEVGSLAELGSFAQLGGIGGFAHGARRGIQDMEKGAPCRAPLGRLRGSRYPGPDLCLRSRLAGAGRQ